MRQLGVCLCQFLSQCHYRLSVCCRHRKNVCLVDLTGQNRLLPGLSLKRKSGGGGGAAIVDVPAAPSVHHSSQATDIDMEPDIPWKMGFSETAGMRNKWVVSHYHGWSAIIMGGQQTSWVVSRHHGWSADTMGGQ